MKSIKKSLLLIFALGLIGLISTTANAQDTNGGKTGLGVMIGECH